MSKLKWSNVTHLLFCLFNHGSNSGDDIFIIFWILSYVFWFNSGWIGYLVGFSIWPETKPIHTSTSYKICRIKIITKTESKHTSLIPAFILTSSFSALRAEYRLINHLIIYIVSSGIRYDSISTHSTFYQLCFSNFTCFS